MAITTQLTIVGLFLPNFRIQGTDNANDSGYWALEISKKGMGTLVEADSEPPGLFKKLSPFHKGGGAELRLVSSLSYPRTISLKWKK